MRSIHVKRHKQSNKGKDDDTNMRRTVEAGIVLKVSSAFAAVLRLWEI